MNPLLQNLQPYPFEKLAVLKQDCVPPKHLSSINLSLGEPQHAIPNMIVQRMNTALTHTLGIYPSTRGSEAFRSSVAHWLLSRFKLPSASLDPMKHILPVNGTREALFAFAQCMIQVGTPSPLVLMPNPFYQIYEGAAILAGAAPYFINCLPSTRFLPDFTSVPSNVWARCQLLYICSPNNPSGTILDLSSLQNLIEYANRYDFIIAADECYAEIYADETQDLWDYYKPVQRWAN